MKEKKLLPSILKKRVLLNSFSSTKETIHLEFTLNGLSYEPGDLLGIQATNCPLLVYNIIAAGKWYPSSDILIYNYEINSLSKNIVKNYYNLSPTSNKKLSKLLSDEKRLTSYIRVRNISDLVADYPILGLSHQKLIKILPKLTPRLYSISSSPKAHPGEAHLTVAVPNKGVCSTYLADKLRVGRCALVYTKKNKNFKLPLDYHASIIMVGVGTGIAPFRAFIEERTIIGSKGRNWLFFGNKYSINDFFYQADWTQYIKSCKITCISTALSRDYKNKFYIQHSMIVAGKELYYWIKNGSYFYVCGNAMTIANEVHQALIRIIATYGNKSIEDAVFDVKMLQIEHRYQQNIY